MELIEILGNNFMDNNVNLIFKKEHEYHILHFDHVEFSVQTVTNSIELPASITYIASVPCRDHLVLNEIQRDFQITLSGIVCTLKVFYNYTSIC